jgi:hypothetical protein
VGLRHYGVRPQMGKHRGRRWGGVVFQEDGGGLAAREERAPEAERDIRHGIVASWVRRRRVWNGAVEGRGGGG